VVRSLAILVALTGIAVGAGCGEDQRDAYADDFQSLSRRLVALGEEVELSIQTASGKSDEQLQREFDKLADRLGRLRRELDGLDPPDDLASTQKELVEAMDAVEAALRGIERAAAGGNAGAARRSTIELVRASEGVRAARRELARETR
jgi:predicted  nucleic acid-binding Zn-ribbon protein